MRDLDKVESKDLFLLMERSVTKGSGLNMLLERLQGRTFHLESCESPELVSQREWRQKPLLHFKIRPWTE